MMKVPMLNLVAEHAPYRAELVNALGLDLEKRRLTFYRSSFREERGVKA